MNVEPQPAPKCDVCGADADAISSGSSGEHATRCFVHFTEEMKELRSAMIMKLDKTDKQGIVIGAALGAACLAILVWAFCC